ncbi:MAG: dihydroorotate dehydrogenase electron transfer subunit [Chitinispirillia bacterium]|jgi:dihydroorotate dehydrogenase electron transfer subunit
MIHTFSEIYSNRIIAKDLYFLEFSWNDSESIPTPGQFVTVRTSESTVPLLRRPFAFSGFSAKKGLASILYQKRGQGTEQMTGKEIGDTLDIIGPFGNGFSTKPSIEKYILVAGGTGLGPILYSANMLNDLGKEILLIIGAQNKVFLPQKEIFRSLSPIILTNDGSYGNKGTTVDFLLSLSEKQYENTAVFACGPYPMLKKCHEFSEKHHLTCKVSFEQVMACGVGACMGCVIKTAHQSRYARVCKEGPVFNSEDILWT